MRKIKFVLISMLFFIVSMSMLACSNDEKKPTPTPQEPVYTIKITGENSMYVGDSQTLKVTATKDGIAETTGIAVSIKSGADKVSLVGKTVKALKDGKAVIEAKVGDKSTEFEITVSSVVGLNFEKKDYLLKTMDLAVNSTVVLGVTGILNGSDMTAADIENLTWESSDKTIATVSGRTVTFLKEGKVTVTVSYNGLGQTTCEVSCLDYTSYKKIENKQQLLDAAASDVVNENGEKWETGTKYFYGKYVLTADIDLNGQVLTGNESNIFGGHFLGVFDGNGYSISNFDVDGAWAGIFGNIGADGTSAETGTGLVRDLSLFCNNYRTNLKSSVLAGTAWGNGVIDNCFVYVDKITLDKTLNVTEKPQDGAGFIVVNVYNGGTVKNCIESGNWVAGTKTQGIRRIGFMQNAGTFLNNVSLMKNMPDGTTNSDAENNTILDYSQEAIKVNAEESAEINMILDGYSLEVVSENAQIAVVDELGSVTGIGKGETNIVIKATSLLGDKLMANGEEAFVKVPITVYNGLLAPSEYSYNKSVVSWGEVEGAASYVVSVQKNNEQAVESNELTTCSYDIASLISGAGTYTVKVKAISEGGKSDGYSTSLVIKGLASYSDLKTINNVHNTNFLLVADIDCGGTILDDAGGNRPAGNLMTTSIFDGNGHSIKNFKTAGWQNIFNEVKGVIRNLDLNLVEAKLDAKSAPLFDTSYGGEFNNINVTVENVIGNAGLNGGNNNVASLFGARLKKEGDKKSVMENCSVIAYNWTGDASGYNYIFGDEVADECVVKSNVAVLYNAPSTLGMPNAENTVIMYNQVAISVKIGGSADIIATVPAGYKVNYVADDSSKAAISGVAVTGVAAGETFILAYITKADDSQVISGKDVIIKIPVTVREVGPAAPSVYSYNGSNITWGEVQSATKYIVSVQKNNEQAVESNELTACSYDIASLISGAGTYTIKVKAINESGDSEGYSTSIAIRGLASYSALSEVKEGTYKNYLLVGDLDAGGFDNIDNAPGGNVPAGNLAADATFDGNGYAIKGITFRAWHSLFGEIKGTVRNLDIDVDQYFYGAKSATICNTSYGGEFYNVHINIASVTSSSLASNNPGSMFAIAFRAEGSKKTIVKDCSVVVKNWTGDASANNYVFGQEIAGGCEITNNTAVLFNVPTSVTSLNSASNTTLFYTQGNVSVKVGERITLSTDIAEGYKLNFASENSSVASLANANLTGTGAGNTTVIATLTKGDGSAVIDGRVIAFKIAVTVS